MAHPVIGRAQLTMTPAPLPTRLQDLLTRTVDGKRLFGAAVSVHTGDGRLAFTGAAGDLTVDQPFFIASTTKLYVTALVFQLRASGALSLEDPLSRFLPAAALQGLHTLNGVDHTGALTVRRLLSHTSGLPDYFQGKPAGGPSLEAQLTAGRDQAWTFEQALARARTLRPAFVPGARGRALYSDTNFQLLGRMVERLHGAPFAEVVRKAICAPLGLTRTYLYTDPHDTRPAPLYFKQAALRIPQAMASFGADGGVVSTASELMTFLQAFFAGRLFPAAYLQELPPWNRIFFPLTYGLGVARFQLPRLFSPFQPAPELIGHSGLSGAFAFYAPARDVYLAGTVNQVAHPDLSFRLMLNLLAAVDAGR